MESFIWYALYALLLVAAVLEVSKKPQSIAPVEETVAPAPEKLPEPVQTPVALPELTEDVWADKLITEPVAIAAENIPNAIEDLYREWNNPKTLTALTEQAITHDEVESVKTVAAPVAIAELVVKVEAQPQKLPPIRQLKRLAVGQGIPRYQHLKQLELYQALQQRGIIA